MRKYKQNIIALVYDFDGTLTPNSMQEYTLLPKIGVKDARKFWDGIYKDCVHLQAENTLMWMKKIIDLAKNEGTPISKEYFNKIGGDITYFAGVPGYFDNINKYIESKVKGNMEVRHYIISSGLKEILDGISIRNEFFNVFGSEYLYDKEGYPDFPKVAITDTVKTQYLFRINKGKEKIGESINEHTPENDRPIPFKNMIYIGDGLSDVPAMNVTKKNGGYAIAIYKPGEPKGKNTCQKLLEADRVNFIAPADYRKDSILVDSIKVIVDTIIQQYEMTQYIKRQNNK
ncbi:MAG: haloacid dehalogenase-like hydrolase [Elusimicrobia bacterium]|nr:haloacid dehalogenase-like hydrolase [Candidatus Liberimonas magnetica]